MFSAFVPIERIPYRFGRHVRCDLEPLHEWLRPRAIGTSPFSRVLRRSQDSPCRFNHAYHSTLIFCGQRSSLKIETRPSSRAKSTRVKRNPSNSDSPPPPDNPIAHCCIPLYVEIRSYVIPEPKHLIAALQKILSELELADAPAGRDEESSSNLKRILKQRIQDLENCTPSSPSRSVIASAATNPD